MPRRIKPERENIEEYHAKITIDMIIRFRDQIKLDTDTENQMCDKRKLSDYDLQQFRCFIQRFIKTDI